MTKVENALQHSQFRELTLLELDEPGSATNAVRALTHSLDFTKEGLAMNATRNSLPNQRRVSSHAHPELAEAVTISRFWRSVNIGNEDECWPWLGDTNKGYGVFYYQGKMAGAHELSLSFSTGEKRHPSLDTCHSCDNPICCNPHHLRFDTRKSNVAEMHDRNRAPRIGKLTESDVVTIRERRALGARQIDLAEQFGISNGEISMIVRGLRHPHAGGPIETKRSQYRKAV